MLYWRRYSSSGVEYCTNKHSSTNYSHGCSLVAKKHTLAPDSICFNWAQPYLHYSHLSIEILAHFSLGPPVLASELFFSETSLRYPLRGFAQILKRQRDS